MYVPISRGAVTGLLFTHLKNALANGPILVGRGIAPQGGGWVSGQPGVGQFVQYTVLKTGQAITPPPGTPDTLGKRSFAWQLTWTLAHHSDMESKADLVGDVVREALASLWPPNSGLEVDGRVWVCQGVLVPTLGPSQRDDSTDPAHWSITDGVSVVLSLASRG